MEDKLNNQDKKIVGYKIFQIVLFFIWNYALFVILEMSMRTLTKLSGRQIISWTFTHWNVTLVNCLIIASISLFLICLTGSLYIGNGISSMILIAYAVGNYLKIESRSEPVFPSEISMISDPGSLAKWSNGGKIAIAIVFMIAAFSVTIFVMNYINKKLKINNHNKTNYILRILGGITSIVFLIIMAGAGNSKSAIAKSLNKNGNYNIEFNQSVNYSVNGVALGFTYNITSDKMDKPANYSEAEVKKIAEKYSNKAKTYNRIHHTKNQKINIIYILNESLTNPSIFKSYYKIKGDKNPTPYINSAINHPNSTNQGGYMVSPGYGGGTANIEFEAITGFSTFYLNTIAYQSVVPNVKSFPSLASYLNNNGYNSIAYHSYSGNIYKRNIAYPKLGFSKFIDQSKMKYKGKSKHSMYISDAQTYKNMEPQYKKKGQQFSLTVTMQNHMPYLENVSSNYHLTKKIDNNAETTKKMETYLQDTHDSDVAYENLTKYIKTLKHKTMIVMWGDHLPAESLFQDVYSSDTLKAHQTPLVISSNFKLPKNMLNKNTLISPNYVTPTVMKGLNYHQTSFNMLMLDMKSTVPVLTKPIQIDSKGTVNKGKAKTSDANQANNEFEKAEVSNKATKKTKWKNSKTYKDYQMIEYDMMYGHQYAYKYKMFK